MFVRGGGGLSAKKKQVFVVGEKLNIHVLKTSICTWKKTEIFAYISVGGGGVKALADMSAKNICFFWTAS